MEKSRFGLDGLATSENTKMTRPPLSSLTLAVNLVADGDFKSRDVTCVTLSTNAEMLNANKMYTSKIALIIATKWFQFANNYRDFAVLWYIYRFQLF